MSEPAPAVFLSYASQDGDAVKRMAQSLQAAGIDVWFDQDELAGGDAWDQKIRGQIKACALFVPVISAATQARREGYFRIEWKLAALRTHAIADGVPFLLPVVIDGTKDADALVPAEFRAVQWTRLPTGVALNAFAARVNGLLTHSQTEADVAPSQESPTRSERKRGTPRAAVILCAALGVAGIFWILWRRNQGAAEITRSSAPLSPTEKPRTTGPTYSEARQLAERAKALTSGKYNSTADDFAAAEGLLKRALERDENDAEIWAISSEFNTAIRTRGFDFSPERREAARSQAQRALKLDPNSVDGLFALARWQRDNEPDPTVAEKSFLIVLNHDPKHSGALFSLATHYARQNRVDEALVYFQRAAETPAQLPLARYGEFLLYFSRSQFTDAERCARESIAVEPSANSVSGLAMVLLTSRGDVAGATQILDRIPEVSRNDHRAVWVSAYVHLVARNPDAALACLHRMSADYIQDNWFVGPKAYWTGQAHAQAGRTEAARIDYETGLTVLDAKLKLAPSNNSLHVARGEILARLDRIDEALREARLATELSDKLDTALWFVSPVRIYAALGQVDQALPLVEKFLNQAKAGANNFWPLTPALLKVDPLWDKLRGDPRFQALTIRAQQAASPDSFVAVKYYTASLHPQTAIAHLITK